jgi:hypothetical protein
MGTKINDYLDFLTENLNGLEEQLKVANLLVSNLYEKSLTCRWGLSGIECKKAVLNYIKGE